jgi:pimeloyl-ACP methyl ester carboxylesterase
MQFAEPTRPQFVMSADGLRLATYSWGDPDAPPVVLVHGFASGALLNWQAAGWVRDLTRAGYRVVAYDQRGHGTSDKPHDPALFTMRRLVDDLLSVLDTYMIAETRYVGYSLGARVGWQAALDLPDRISQAVLGGMPDGDPLARFRLDEARAFASDGSEIEDRMTEAYMSMAHGIPNNDLGSLISLVEGMRGGLQPDLADPPLQPLLFATGSEDRIIDGSRALCNAAPRGTFFEIPGRDHFNAPTSKPFRDAAIGFLRSEP